MAQGRAIQKYQRLILCLSVKEIQLSNRIPLNKLPRQSTRTRELSQPINHRKTSLLFSEIKLNLQEKTKKYQKEAWESKILNSSENLEKANSEMYIWLNRLILALWLG